MMRRKPKPGVTLAVADFDLGPAPVTIRRAEAVRCEAGWVTPVVWRKDQSGVRRAGPRRIAEYAVGARRAIDTEVSDLPGDANGRRYRRRVSAVERMHRRGALSAAQAAAGEALSAAWEATQKSPSVDLAQDRVDASPRPDMRTLVTVEAAFRYARMAEAVPPAAWPVVFRVACMGVALPRRDGRQARRAADLLRLGLDALSLHLARRG